MESTPTTSNASPFESGDWGRWTNLERCKWLRAFYQELKSKEEHIAQSFKLDKKKMKRLSDAIKVLEAKLKGEFAIVEKAQTYSEAMIDLGMEAMLKIDPKTPVSFPAFGTAKRGEHNGN